jgi:AraC-like DNA-binding protein
VSESEIQLIAEIYKEHGQKDQWQIRDWCHQNCGEWTPLQAGREKIQVEDIAVNVGKSEAEVKRISEEATESNLLSAVFSAPASVYA